MTDFESIKVSKGERIVLQMLEKRLKWLTRDKDGTLCVHEIEPQKKKTSWDSADYCELSAFSHHFQFVQWEDEEPTLINDLLKEK